MFLNFRRFNGEEEKKNRKMKDPPHNSGSSSFNSNCEVKMAWNKVPITLLIGTTLISVFMINIGVRFFTAFSQ